MISQQSTVGARYHSLWTDGKSLAMCVRGRVLNRLDPTSMALHPVAALHSDRPVAYCALDGLVYYTNGVDTGIVQGAARRSWGLVPPAATDVQVTPGALPAGRYLCAMTYIRDDGQESGASDFTTVEVGENAGLFWPGLPTSADPTVTHKALYLSGTNGEVLYRTAVMPAATAVTNISSPADEGAYPLDTANLQPAPAGQLIAWFKGRMWVATDDHLFPSRPFSPELFDLREYLPARGQITMLAPRPDDAAMLIGTDAGIGWLQGDALESLAYVHALDDPVLPGSMVMVPGAQYGDGTAGSSEVVMWTGVEGVYACAAPDWTIRPVTIDRVSQSLRGRVAAVFDRARGIYLATVSS
jgi:hypothetical protein